MKTQLTSISKDYQNYLKKQKQKKLLITIIQFTILIGIFAFWELFAQIGIIDSFITSSPSRIIETIYNLALGGELLLHISTTLYEAIIGFLIATTLGVVIAIILWLSDSLRKILDPFLVVLNSLPKIALGPIIIIWVGIGTSSIIVMDVLIMIIISTLTMLASFVNCDQSKIMLLKSYGANKFQILTKLVIPNSMCDLIGVLKVNVGLTWVGTIMGEYLNSRAGLGYLIVYGGQVFNLDLVMASTILLCVLAGLMYFVVAWFEKNIKKKYNP